MFKWFRQLWRSINPEAPEQDAAAKSHQEGHPRPVPPREQEPVLVRGELWKNTRELRRELKPEQETSADTSLEILIKRLGRVDRAEIRRSAATELGQLGPGATLAISALLSCCVDVDRTVRETALSALNAIDPDWPHNAEARKSFPKLVQALRSWSPEVSKAAFKLLQQIGPLAVRHLVNVLSNEEEKIDKLYAIELLAQIGPEAASAVPGLIRALQSKSVQTRIAAADALANIGPAAEAAIPALVTALADSYADCRRAMAACLASLGEAAEPAIPALLPRLADREFKVREAVVDALTQIGTKTVPALIEIVQARDVQRLKTSLESMSRISQWYSHPKPDSIVIDDQDALDNICWTACDLIEEQASLENAQIAALQVLGKFGPAASAAVPTMTQALVDPNPCIQLVSVQALGKIGPEARMALPNLVKMLLHIDESIQKAAVQALEMIDCNWILNATVAEAVIELTGQLSKDKKPGEIAIHAFEAIGPAGVPLLLTALESGDRVTQENAARALAMINRSH